MTEQALSLPIEVDVLFNGNMVRPQRFRYFGREVLIDKVNLVHHVQRGSHRVYLFSTSNKEAAHVLSFHTGSLEWRLESVWLPDE